MSFNVEFAHRQSRILETIGSVSIKLVIKKKKERERKKNYSRSYEGIESGEDNARYTAMSFGLSWFSI